MTIAVLSLGAERTLENSLSSYSRFGLCNYDTECIVLLQNGTKDQQSICYHYGFKPITIPVNLGIAQGYRRLLEEATGKFFLFLENDWELLRNPLEQLLEAKELIQDGVDVVRFRDRENPGNPLWTRQFKDREYERKTHMLDSIHWTDPDRFKEIDRVGNFYVTSSMYANWTNNPHMAKTSFLIENILPRLGSGDLERDIQSWWEVQDFMVAQGEGLFTHNRLD